MEGCQPLENEQVLIVKENVEGAPSVGWGEVVRQPRRVEAHEMGVRHRFIRSSSLQK